MSRRSTAMMLQNIHSMRLDADGLFICPCDTDYLSPTLKEICTTLFHTYTPTRETSNAL
jgi:hypothetical protein